MQALDFVPLPGQNDNNVTRNKQKQQQQEQTRNNGNTSNDNRNDESRDDSYGQNKKQKTQAPPRRRNVLQEQEQSDFEQEQEVRKDEPVPDDPFSPVTTTPQVVVQPQNTILKRDANQRNPHIVNLERNVEDIVRNGLTYLQLFVGSMGAAFGDRDVRQFFKWRDDPSRGPGKNANLEELTNPVKRGARNLEEFIRMNKHLGSTFLSIVLPSVVDKDFRAQEQEQEVTSTSQALLEMQTIGNDLQRGLFSDVPVQIDDELYIQSLIQKNAPDNGNFPNIQTDWVFSALDDATFHYLLESTSLGAMNMALSMIRAIPNCRNFTLRQLMMSDGVRDKFALFAVYQYQLMSGGGNAYSGRIQTSRGRVSGTSFLLSAGYQTRNALFALVETGKYWFERVRQVQNPRLQQLIKAIDTLKQELLFDELGQPYGSLDPLSLEKRARILDLQQSSGTEQLKIFLARSYYTDQVPERRPNVLAIQQEQEKYDADMTRLTDSYNTKVWEAKGAYWTRVGNRPPEGEGIESDYKPRYKTGELVNDLFYITNATNRLGSNAWMGRFRNIQATEAVKENAMQNYRRTIATLKENFDREKLQYDERLARFIQQSENTIENVFFTEYDVKIIRRFTFKLLTENASSLQLQKMYNSGYLARDENLNINILLNDDEKERLKKLIYLRIMQKQRDGMPGTILKHFE